MEFFEKAFNWLANISARLPKIDFKTYFIVVVAVIVGIGVIIALTYFGSRARKLINASKKNRKISRQRGSNRRRQRQRFHGALLLVQSSAILARQLGAISRRAFRLSERHRQRQERV